MTLVAGFFSFGKPVLVGDFLLTNKAGRVVGLRKKTLVIAPNFALAWTGDLWAAEAVVRVLQGSLVAEPVTMQSVTKVLTDPATATETGRLWVMVVGWVVDESGQHCFRWRTDYPHEVYFDLPIYEGSGADFVQRLLGPSPAGLRDKSPSNKWLGDPVVSGILDVTTRLMASEMVGPSTAVDGFGYAYESAVWDADRGFTYVDDVLYFALTAELDESGKHLRSAYHGRIFKYRCHGNSTVMYVFDPNAKSIEVNLIEPVGRQASEESDRVLRTAELGVRLGGFPFESKHYFAFISVTTPKVVFPPLVTELINDGVDESLKPIDVSGKDVFGVRGLPGRIEWVYQLLAKDKANGAG